MLTLSYIIPVTQSSASDRVYKRMHVYPTAGVTRCHYASAADADPSLSYLHCETGLVFRFYGTGIDFACHILVPGLL